MKKGYKFIALFLAGLVSASIISACSPFSNNDSNTDSNGKNDSLETSVTQIEGDNPANDNSPKNEEEKVSAPESSLQEVSAEESHQQSQDSKEESTEEMPSEEAPEQSNIYNGYYFDDEQIVEDYHNATKFTDNETFNEMFYKNALDESYNYALRDVSSISDMRNITITYAESWKKEVSNAYDKLCVVLDGNDEAKASLEASQEEWTNGLADIERQFYDEASNTGAGSETLLSADTAIMNYYKGRAAVLYENIFEITGEFAM